MEIKYLEPTQESGAAFIKRNMTGQIVMLNLLKFKEFADYSQTPDLAPANTITGEEAFQIYIQQTLPFLRKTGGDILFLGKAGQFLIGPQTEQWDFVMLIRQNSVQDFLAFASDAEYLKVLAHRTAALEDSRLLPLTEQTL
ncbi:MAG: DUF1330 domain-containing protein [Chitinophagaceae bacterium]